MKTLDPKTLFAGRYEVVRCISTGGMGAVYEVLHRETQRRRALKVMLPDLLVDEDLRRRFALEAVITANVASEHLVEVFDAGIEDGSKCPFIVMELLVGEDLGKRLAMHGPLSPNEVCEILKQTARALDKTHTAGIVHRDLKPENLFLTARDDGSPKIKILDFGIAKLLATRGTLSTRALGTPLFMAPEQVDDELAKTGPAVDRYALGQIAYTLLTGSPYYGEELKRTDNMLSILLAVARGAREPASLRAERIGRSLFSGFDAWFAKATSRDPNGRFGSVRELAEAFEQALQTGGAPAATTADLEPISLPPTPFGPTERLETPATPALDTASLDPTVKSNATAVSSSRRWLLPGLALLIVGTLGLVFGTALLNPETLEVTASAIPNAASLENSAATSSNATKSDVTVESPSALPTTVTGEPVVALVPAPSVTLAGPLPSATSARKRGSAPGARPPTSPPTAEQPKNPAQPPSEPWEERTPIKP